MGALFILPWNTVRYTKNILKANTGGFNSKEVTKLSQFRKPLGRQSYLRSSEEVSFSIFHLKRSHFLKRGHAISLSICATYIKMSTLFCRNPKRLFFIFFPLTLTVITRLKEKEVKQGRLGITFWCWLPVPLDLMLLPKLAFCSDRKVKTVVWCNRDRLVDLFWKETLPVYFYILKLF